MIQESRSKWTELSFRGEVGNRDLLSICPHNSLNNLLNESTARMKVQFKESDREREREAEEGVKGQQREHDKKHKFNVAIKKHHPGPFPPTAHTHSRVQSFKTSRKQKFEFRQTGRLHISP